MRRKTRYRDRHKSFSTTKRRGKTRGISKRYNHTKQKKHKKRSRRKTRRGRQRGGNSDLSAALLEPEVACTSKPPTDLDDKTDYPDTFEISRQQNDDDGSFTAMNCNQYKWLDEDDNEYMYRNIGKSQKNITEDGYRLDKPTLTVRCGKKSRWKKETKMCPETVRLLRLRHIKERVADKTGAIAELLAADTAAKSAAKAQA